MKQMIKSGQLTQARVLREVFKIDQQSVENFDYHKKVNQYLIAETIGKGSFAKVKLAMHMPTAELVAIKILDKEKCNKDESSAKYMRRESRILSQLSHPGIIRLLEVLESKHCLYFVLERCPGSLLVEVLQNGKLPESRVKRYFKQIVLAVDYMHRSGVLHRDLKAENILLTESDNIKIIDFGLSTLVKPTQGVDGSLVTQLCRTQCGSPAYAAPEVLARKPYGHKADIWSVGVNLYIMVVGFLPFSVPQPVQMKALCQMMMNREMKPIPSDISKECVDLIHKFLDPNPDTRISLEQVLKHFWLNKQRTMERFNVSSLADKSRMNSQKSLESSRVGIMPMRESLTNLSATIASSDMEIHGEVMRRSMEISEAGRVELYRLLKTNTPSSVTATYYLLLNKLKRFCRSKGIIPESVGDFSAKSVRQSDPTLLPLKFIEKNSQLQKETSSWIQAQEDYESAHPVPNPPVLLKKSMGRFDSSNTSMGRDFSSIHSFDMKKNSPSPGQTVLMKKLLHRRQLNHEMKQSINQNFLTPRSADKNDNITIPSYEAGEGLLKLLPQKSASISKRLCVKFADVSSTNAISEMSQYQRSSFDHSLSSQTISGSLRPNILAVTRRAQTTQYDRGAHSLNSTLMKSKSSPVMISTIHSRQEDNETKLPIRAQPATQLVHYCLNVRTGEKELVGIDTKFTSSIMRHKYKVKTPSLLAT